jgi:putative transposase
MRACGCLNAAGASASAPRPHRTVPVADAPDAVWAVDLQFDATTDGRPVKIVSIVDERTRECLGGLVDRNITSDDLIVELDRLAALRGYPAVLRWDNGPQLICAAMADWAGERTGLNINMFWSLA